MISKLKLITAPAIPAVSLADAKLQLRVDNTDDDTFITSLLNECINFVQEHCGIQLITATYEQYLDEFPSDNTFFYLKKNPVQNPITSIKYYDAAGVLQTLATDQYWIDENNIPAKIMLRNSVTDFPDTEDERPNAVIVRFKAGYGDAVTSVPENIIRALKLLINTWYDNRTTQKFGEGSGMDIPQAVLSLLNQNKISEFF